MVLTITRCVGRPPASDSLCYYSYYCYSALLSLEVALLPYWNTKPIGFQQRNRAASKERRVMLATTPLPCIFVQ